MARPRIVLHPTDSNVVNPAAAALRARFAAVRAELGVDGPYPSEALAEAVEVAARIPSDAPDETDLPYVTLDPPGSMDLDQAMHLEKTSGGYRVRYAIADVPGFVALGGALDAATRERGQTIYCPDERVPLHPPVLSEAAASLLPGQVRPAYVWDLHLDAEGEVTESSVHRAMVRSVERLDYRDVQQRHDAGDPHPRLALLREIGELRIAREVERGGANLPMPEQEVNENEDGSFSLQFRPPVPAEEWNAQISLMTGMVAADLMIGAGVGVLRTMPAPTSAALGRFRRAARGLGVSWPQEVEYGEFIRGLDRTHPRHLALIHEATALFRGAGYTAFDGDLPDEREHSAVAAPYAHVTAPLRRLIDRFGLLVCAAACAGEEVPDAVRAALPELPERMRDSDRRARAAERACADATEAAVLLGREGERFGAVVIDHLEKGVEVQLLDWPILARVTGERAPLGEAIEARLTTADIEAGRLTFVYP